MATCTAAKRILVCDDDKDILDLLSHILTQAGYTVATAGEHKSFMQRFNEAKPDLILLDVRMPEKDGFSIAEQIQGDYRGPIIFITAHDRPVYRMCVPIVGATDYLPKPIDPEVLLARIEHALHPQPHPRSSSRFLEALGDA
jgi:DNA-binding response OmpR family regulator